MAKPKEIIATKVEVMTTSGPNKTPRSGYATFSDGAYYHFNYFRDDDEAIFGVRGRNNCSRSMRMPKRSAALRAAFESGTNVEFVVIQVKL